jgi:hypothetical protein
MLVALIAVIGSSLLEKNNGTPRRAGFRLVTHVQRLFL